MLAVTAPSAQAQERLEWAVPARACLGGDASAFATFDATLPGGGVRLVVHRAEGRTEVCDVAASGEVRDRIREPPGARVPRPEERAFFLERRCVDARRVEAEDGAILGWLAYPACG